MSRDKNNNKTITVMEQNPTVPKEFLYLQEKVVRSVVNKLANSFKWYGFGTILCATVADTGHTITRYA